MILLDTNVVSETMRATPEPKVVAWLDAQAAETLYLSSVSLAELLFEIASLQKSRRRETLERSLTETTARLFADRVLPFDVAAARCYADIVSRARRAGKAIGGADGQIAAIAATHDLAVATRDKGPFKAAGARVIDPWASEV